jgi:hypothetical protein
MGTESNVVKFQQRFTVMPCIFPGCDVFYFVFSKTRELPDSFDGLPQNSRLQRALAAHYQNGNYIRELEGYFVYHPTK